MRPPAPASSALPQIPSDDEAAGEGLEHLAQQRASALAAHRAAVQHMEGGLLGGPTTTAAAACCPSHMLTYGGNHRRWGLQA